MYIIIVHGLGVFKFGITTPKERRAVIFLADIDMPPVIKWFDIVHTAAKVMTDLLYCSCSVDPGTDYYHCFSFKFSLFFDDRALTLHSERRARRGLYLLN